MDGEQQIPERSGSFRLLIDVYVTCMDGWMDGCDSQRKSVQQHLFSFTIKHRTCFLNYDLLVSNYFIYKLQNKKFNQIKSFVFSAFLLSINEHF